MLRVLEVEVAFTVTLFDADTISGFRIRKKL
jgi:hypothetical protein